MAHGVPEYAEFVPAGHSPFLHRVARATDQPAQARRIYGGHTLQAPSAHPRPLASASPALSVPSAVITWAGHRLGTPANRRQLALQPPLPYPRSQRCPSRRKRDQ
jgi:hypothetical protein